VPADLLATLDEAYWLSGDEDTGVGLQCRLCDRGGLPVAYYCGISTAYEDRADVASVNTIAALLDAGRRHLAEQH
jgi:hypothetical protein